MVKTTSKPADSMKGTQADDIKRAGEVKYWLDQMEQAKKREDEYRKRARKCVEIYEGESNTQNRFNILYANTETLLPALYTRLPKPVIERRFRKTDPLAQLCAQVIERLLVYLMDTGYGGYTSFDDLMKDAVLQALVPGRGATEFRYEPKIESERVVHEYIEGRQIPWDRFLHGFGRLWDDVPWCAIEDFWSAEELIQNVGDEIAAKVKLTATAADVEQGTDRHEGPSIQRNYDSSDPDLRLAHVYIIWNKVTREVIIVSDGYKDDTLRKIDDPLGLTSFYPWARPMFFIDKIKNLVPVPLYTQYEAQAEELNRISGRIMSIIKAIQAKGVYDGRLGPELDRLFTETGENQLVAATGTAAFTSDAANLNNAIWFMPIEKLINVLQQLYVNRQQVKSIIYEITGIADILRGASSASESATAQQIKQQWGSVRLRKMRNEVARYIRDSLRIMAELAITRFDGKTISVMTGIELLTAEEKQQAQTQLMQAELAAQMQGGGPQPPDPRLQELLSKPTWDEVLSTLRDDRLRSYKIDIQTNSTIDADIAEDKQDVQEFMGAAGQFLNASMSMVQAGIMPFEAAKAMLLAIAQRTRFGVEIEDELRKMTPPQTPDQKGQQEAEAKMQAEQARIQIEQQKAQAAAQIDQLKAQSQAQLRAQKQQADAQLETQRMQFDREIAQQRATLDMQIAREKMELERQKVQAELALERELEMLKMQHEVASNHRTESREETNDNASHQMLSQMMQMMNQSMQALAAAVASIGEAKRANGDLLRDLMKD